MRVGSGGWRVVPAVAVLALGMVMPAHGHAQDELLPGPGIALVGGVYELNTDSTDTGTFFGLRLDFPLASWAVLEAGVEHAGYDRAGVSEARWVTDFAVRAEWRSGRVHPYLGGSLGAVFDLDDERLASEDFVAALYGGLAGVRFDLTDRIGVRVEARARWFDGLEDRVTLYGAGLRWRF